MENAKRTWFKDIDYSSYKLFVFVMYFNLLFFIFSLLGFLMRCNNCFSILLFVSFIFFIMSFFLFYIERMMIREEEDYIILQNEALNKMQGYSE